MIELLIETACVSTSKTGHVQKQHAFIFVEKIKLDEMFNIIYKVTTRDGEHRTEKSTHHSRIGRVMQSCCTPILWIVSLYTRTLACVYGAIEFPGQVLGRAVYVRYYTCSDATRCVRALHSDRLTARPNTSANIKCRSHARHTPPYPIKCQQPQPIKSLFR